MSKKQSTLPLYSKLYRYVKDTVVDKFASELVQKYKADNSFDYSKEVDENLESSLNGIPSSYNLHSIPEIAAYMDEKGMDVQSLTIDVNKVLNKSATMRRRIISQVKKELNQSKKPSKKPVKAKVQPKPKKSQVKKGKKPKHVKKPKKKARPPTPVNSDEEYSSDEEPEEEINARIQEVPNWTEDIEEEDAEWESSDSEEEEDEQPVVEVTKPKYKYSFFN
jgi:hypothetical protein